MKSDFWYQRWQQNEIGFHKNKPNSYLTAHWNALRLARDSCVFVPLCGKTQDMIWLAAKGYKVIGVELSQIAVKDFFDDAQITPQISKNGELLLYESPNISIYCGDLFALNINVLEKVTAVYDRGALVALPQAMRQAYMAHLWEILPGTVNGLLVTMDYDQSLLQGPPFSISASELSQLFDANSKISELEHEDIVFRDETVRMHVWHYVRS